MRSSLCIAAGLLVTNLVVNSSHDEPKPQRDTALPTAAPIASRIDRVYEPRAEDARLRALWLAVHAGLHETQCAYPDPLATLDADVDEAPGREHVIGNRRYGVAMFAESGELIGMMDAIGCPGSATDSDQSLSLGFQSRLVVRTRLVERDGEYLEARIVDRVEDKLVTRATVDVGGERDTSVVFSALYISDDEVLVKSHGRRLVDGQWQAVDDHYTLRFMP